MAAPAPWSRRRRALLAAVATVWLMGGAAAETSGADDVRPPKCDVTGPTTRPSDEVQGGTMVAYSVKCRDREEVLVEVTIEMGQSLLFKSTDAIRTSGKISFRNALHLPIPSGARVCATVDGARACVST